MKQILLPDQLSREAYVYVRQSTSAQVREYTESRDRQYALVDRAVEMGWRRESVVVVDDDQGKSGSTARGRDGFARLSHAVAHGKVGAIFSLEVSRLARSSQDWQRLLSLCSVAGVLVMDEQSTWDPSQHDDKLILDLKGAMSEQELHWLSLRLAGGRLNKARRGEAYVTPAAGYVWGTQGLKLDPDESIRNAVKVVFERFEVEPSARSVLRWCEDSGFLMPTRLRGTSEITWTTLGNGRLLSMLHNPSYAGVYVFGRHQTRKVLIDGEIRTVQVRQDNPDDWSVKIDNAHPAYITWDTHMRNLQKLRDNNSKLEASPRTAPRESESLLSGILLCGQCGLRMSSRYLGKDSRLYYVCQRSSDGPMTTCWTVPGDSIDRAVESLFMATMNPGEIELSLAVEIEIGRQTESIERAWKTRIEQVRYQTKLAERRYKAVDPENRVVARTLESEWEQQLREQDQVEKQLDKARASEKVELDAGDRKRIRQIARDLPTVWKAKTTSMADRKTMLRLVIEMICLSPVERPARATRIRVQWQSGVVSELEVPRPARGEHRKHSIEVLNRLGELASAGHHDAKIAELLNNEKLMTGAGLEWNEDGARHARIKAGIKRVAPDRPRHHALPGQRSDGKYSIPGVMAKFGVSEGIVGRWLAKGLIHSVREDFGSHRNVHWIEIGETEASELAHRAGGRRLMGK